MAEPSSPIILTPADFADTGQWRLLIYITHTGMRALLRHATDRERPLLQLLNEEWEPASAGVQMSKIENTVYAHPSLLDDYATEVVVETPRVAWMPDVFMADGSIGEDSVYHTVFAASEGDVLTDRTGEATALYEFLPDFDSFMARTLPGARLRCHLGVLVERFLAESRSDDPTLRIYMDLRQGEADLIALRSGRLVSASVQPWHTVEEAAYRIFHLLNAYSTDRTGVKVSVNGMDAATVEGVLSLTAGFCREAMPMQLPDGARRSGLPLSAALLVYKNDTHMRIIRGKYGRRRFDPPKNITARPTTDFARENIFNVIENLEDIEGKSVCDLFAGTGAVAFEFLSREAAEVTAVELAQTQVGFIRSVKEKLAADNMRIIKGDVFRFIEGSGRSYDIVFADPPYNHPRFDEIPGMILASHLVKEGTLVIVEHNASRDYSGLPGFFQRREYGSVNFSLFRVGGAAPAHSFIAEEPDSAEDQDASTPISDT